MSICWCCLWNGLALFLVCYRFRFGMVLVWSRYGFGMVSLRFMVWLWDVSSSGLAYFLYGFCLIYFVECYSFGMLLGWFGDGIETVWG